MNQQTKQLNNYQDALEYINNLASPKDKKFKPGMHLERLRKFLDKVGNPQDSYKSIHIGGTAGKGSTSYLTAKILAELGYKVGLHTSPHLRSLNEKFMLSNVAREFLPCTDQEFVELVDWLVQNREKYEETEEFELTYYESIIAMVFKFFETKKIDYAVVEVAVGGKLDATNVLKSAVSVLTSVGLDHTKILGDTKELIIQDKMQILEPGSTMVTGVTESSLLEILKPHAESLNSELKVLHEDFDFEILESGLIGSKFNFKNSSLEIHNLELSLVGEFQVQNASVAAEAVWNKVKDSVDKQKFISALQYAFTNSKLGSRFEIAQKDPLIILDGAHNPLKMKKFVDSLLSYIGDKEISLLFSCSADKDLVNILEELKRVNIKSIYISEFKKSYYKDIHSYSNDKMREQLKSFFPTITIKAFTEPQEAFKMFKSSLDKNDIGVVTGSLYLLGNIYT